MLPPFSFICNFLRKSLRAECMVLTFVPSRKATSLAVKSRNENMASTFLFSWLMVSSSFSCNDFISKRAASISESLCFFRSGNSSFLLSSPIPSVKCVFILCQCGRIINGLFNWKSQLIDSSNLWSFYFLTTSFPVCIYQILFHDPNDFMNL